MHRPVVVFDRRSHRGWRADRLQPRQGTSRVPIALPRPSGSTKVWLGLRGGTGELDRMHGGTAADPRLRWASFSPPTRPLEPRCSQLELTLILSYARGKKGEEECE